MLGWTGGQYSLLRVGLAVCVAKVCLDRLPFVEGAPAALLVLAIGLSVALAIGWRSLAVGLNLIALIVLVVGPIDGAPLVLPLPDVVFSLAGLLLHTTFPPAPYGSWDARDRIDPRGDWQRPVWSLQLARLGLAALLLLRAWGLPQPPGSGPAWLSALAGPATLLAALVALLFALTPRTSRWAPALWLALLLWQLACTTAFGPTGGDAALLLLYLFAVDPGWWPGVTRAGAGPAVDEGESTKTARLYYDGDCGFCHNSVRLILAEEVATPPALRLRFAPLAGETFAQEMAAHSEIDPEALPDSIVLVLEDGRLLTRASAALEIAARLGGFWRAIAALGRRLPLGPLDRLYDTVARVRKRIFATPSDACPILPPDLRARFDP